jgi:cytochrome c-type biogenesis protein
MSEWRLALQQADLTGLVVSFTAGFVFSFNPVSFTSIPVAIAYVTKARTFREALLLGSAFVTGMVVTHVVLGTAAALGGEWAHDLMGRQWSLVLGPVLIVLGLIWTGWVRMPLPWISARGRRVASVWGAFLLGIPFTVGICPVCSPGLWVALTASAGIGSASYGALLLLMFALGRGVPVIIGVVGVGWLESLRPLMHWQKPLEIIGGLTLILTGLYLLNETLFWIAL